MANWFGNNKGSVSPAQQLDTRYRSTRHNLLVVVAFTVVNLGLLLFGGSTYFLFSAFVPYYAVSIGMLYCGMFPAEYYTDGLEGMEFVGMPFFYTTLAIAIVGVLLYLLCWIFSGKGRVGWMIAALIMMVLDTVCMLWLGGFSADSSIDIFFHIGIIVSLLMGIIAQFQLKKMSTSEKVVEAEFSEAPQTNVNTSYKRAVDPTEKARILLETNALGHHIVYRRVKRVNELVIDGYVYDRTEMLVEFEHCLRATVDGHLFEVGYDGKSHSYALVDGKSVAKKLRIW